LAAGFCPGNANSERDQAVISAGQFRYWPIADFFHLMRQRPLSEQKRENFRF
jgi:hypothetical protein